MRKNYNPRFDGLFSCLSFVIAGVWVLVADIQANVTATAQVTNSEVEQHQNSKEYQHFCDVEDSIRKLASASYIVRLHHAECLQRLGWQAADQLIRAQGHATDLEQSQAIERLVQQLPSLHLVVVSVSPDCPNVIVQRLRDFQAKTFSEKAAVVRFLGQFPDAEIRRLSLFAIARFESDSLVRDFAATVMLDDIFPIQDVKAYTSPTSDLLSQIPEREDTVGYLSLLGSDSTNWILGATEIKNGSVQNYSLLPKASGSNNLTPQAQLIRSCLIHHNAGQSFLTGSLLASIADRTHTAVVFPLSASSPQRFALHYEVLVRTARWGMIHARHVKALESDYLRLIDSLNCLGQDPDCFQSQAALFCELAITMNQPEWLQQWHNGSNKSTFGSNPTSALALSDAAFRLNCDQLAKNWLEQDFLSTRSRFSALQFAVLADELGYSKSHRYLLSQLASRPINNSAAIAMAKLLNAEALAVDCDYSNAAHQLGWLLTSLHNDVALASKIEKRLPNGLNEIRTRYHYFRAQDAANHRDWPAAVRHLSIGHSLSPYDTNILTLAWELEPHLIHAESKFRWNPSCERREFIERHWALGLLNSTSLLDVAERHSDFPLPQSQSIANSGFTTAKGQEQDANLNSIQGNQWNLNIQFPTLEGGYLYEQTTAALEHFELEIQQQQFIVAGAGRPAAQRAAARRLSANLNRWAYLATACEIETERAYQRAKLATALAKNSPAYFDTLARCCQNTGRLNEAIDATRTAMTLAPHDSTFRTRLATLQTLALSNLR